MKKHPDTATGRLVAHIPAGADRDELLGLVRMAVKFKSNQTGRHAGFLRQYLGTVVARMKPPVTFTRLLYELELEAVRRNKSDTGKGLPPVETVNRVLDAVIYHDPKRGRLQVKFATLRNHLSKVPHR